MYEYDPILILIHWNSICTDAQRGVQNNVHTILNEHLKRQFNFPVLGDLEF